MALRRLPRRTAAVAAAVVLAVAGTLSPSPAAATSPGSLVLVGGALNENAQIVQRIVALAGGPGVARIGIITAASAPAKTAAEAGDDTQNNAAANGLYYGALFKRFGAREVYAVPLDTSGGVGFRGDTYSTAAASNPDVVARARTMTGFFLGGGDQARYVDTMMRCDAAHTTCQDTPLLSAVRHRLARGAVVAGTSAGADILQGADMVTGGESYQGWRDGAKPGYFEDPTVLGYYRSGGFGFFGAGQVDAHVGVWGRQGRMIRLGLDTGHPFSFGVDEETALVVTGVGTGYERMSVIGVHGVSIFDLRAARRPSEDVVRRVRWSYLRNGDRYDPRTHEATLAGWKTPLSTPGQPDLTVGPRRDIWSSADSPVAHDYAMVRLAQRLMRSDDTRAYGTTYESGPRYRVTLTEHPSTYGALSSAGATRTVSFVRLGVSVAPH